MRATRFYGLMAVVIALCVGTILLSFHWEVVENMAEYAGSAAPPLGMLLLGLGLYATATKSS